ncbi:MAG: class I SAM-dependent methyltransferase [Tahibacter sp.]
MNPTPELNFTGERFTPECVREIWYEHWHRYAFARSLAAGRRVLDAACGEGYGSAILAVDAASVLGVDIDALAIAHASTRYGDQTNLHFERADATALHVTPGSIDLVVSFETLEHVEAQDALVNGFASALTEEGLLLISCPDKAVYSDAAGFQNEFHVRELYRDELLSLLGRYFPHVRLYGQKLLFQSVIWGDGSAAGSHHAVTAHADRSLTDGLDYAPVYFLALCSRRPLPDDLPGLSLFGDRDESVYSHYNHEIRKNMAAGKRIAELEAELADLRRRPADDVLESADRGPHPDPSVSTVAWWRRWLARKPHD